MKLLIISNMAHYEKNGVIVGWGPAVREIDQIAQLFNKVIHIGCLHDEPAPASALPYSSTNIQFIGLPPSGGRGFRAKWGIIRKIPLYIRNILHELPRVDMVHVRCPANIALLAIILLTFCRRPKYRWIKYAGNWRPEGKEPWSYRFQRWWLRKNFHRGIVTMNDYSIFHPPHVVPLFNPSIYSEEIERFRDQVKKKCLQKPVRLLFSGALTENKGILTALDVVKGLKDKKIDFKFDIVGDGPLRKELQDKVKEYRLDGLVRFHGWIPRSVIHRFYLCSHFLLLPTRSEGWPKVLGESMAYGVVPLVGAVSCIPHVLKTIKCGRALSPQNIDAFKQAILEYLDKPDLWRREKENGFNASWNFTYENFLSNIRDVMRKIWNIEI